MKDNSVFQTEYKYGQLYAYINDLTISRSLFLYGEYSEKELTISQLYLKDNSTIVDVGANIGVHSIAYSTLSPNGKVFSFEPNPTHYEVLQANIELNNKPNITAFNLAISNTVGESFISDFDEHEGENYGTTHLADDGIKTTVSTLDSIIDEHVDLIKIDTEGYEPHVIDGAKNLIEKYMPTIILEFHHLENQPAMIKTLFDHGYDCYWLPVRNFEVHNYKTNPVNLFASSGVINILAISKDKTPPKQLAKVKKMTETYQDMIASLTEEQLLNGEIWT